MSMKKLILYLSRKMSNTRATILFALIIVVLVFSIAMFFKSKFIADMLSPVGLKAYLYGGCENDHNGRLSVLAYGIGTIFFSGLTVALITNFLRTLGDRYNTGTLDKYPWSDHALFLGFDEMMMGTLHHAANTYTKVVVAVSDDVREMRSHLHSNLPDCDNIEVVQCNRTSLPDLQNKACFGKAGRIFIIGNPDEPTHDAINMKSLAMIASFWCEEEHRMIGEGKTPKVPHIMVYLRNQSTFSIVQQQEFKAKNLWGILDKTPSSKDDNSLEQVFMNRYCEFFNFYCDKAISLLSADNGLKPDWHSEKKNLSIMEYSDKRVHLVVIGMTEMGVAIVREVLKLAHPSGIGTKYLITLVDDRAYEEMHYFIGRTKELFKRCHYTFRDFDNPSLNYQYMPDDNLVDVEFEFIKCDVAHPKLTSQLMEWATSGKELLSIVICSNDSPKNMAVALYFPSELISGEDAVPIWVYQTGDDSVSLLKNSSFAHLHTFSINDHVVHDIATSQYYSPARKIAIYYDQYYGENETPKSWDETSSSDRWSSIYNVLSIGIKLRCIGIPNVNRNITLHDEQKKLVVDTIEHNRWIVEKLSAGYIPTNEEQHATVMKELKECIEKYPLWKTDKNQRISLEKERKEFKALKKGETVKGIKIHDDLRSFDNLSEYTKDKDRIMLDSYISTIQNLENS